MRNYRRAKKVSNVDGWLDLLVKDAKKVRERVDEAPRLLEKDIQKHIMQYLELQHIEASVTNADRAFGKGGGVRASKVPKGHPDVTAVMPVLVGGMLVGLAWYIEVKTPTGSLSVEQKEKLTSLARAGALCTVARDVSLVMRIVQQLANKPYTIADKVRFDKILDLTINHRRTKDVREQIENLLSDSTNDRSGYKEY